MKKIFILIPALLIMLSLVGCGERKLYKEADALLEAGSYEEAIVKFQELGDYEDSAAKCEEAKNSIEYDKGVELLNAEDFVNAQKVFSPLGDFKDSAEKLEEAKNGEKYESGMELLKEQNYGQAYLYLSTLRDYKDANTYLDRYTTIEITPDNWDTYFEVKELSFFQEDPSGEVFDIVQCQAVLLKEEYLPKYCFDLNSMVSFNFSFDCGSGNMKVDPEARTYEKPVCYNFENHAANSMFYDLTVHAQNGTIDLSSGKQISFFIADAVPSPFGPANVWMGADIENIELTGVNGSITLYN